MDKKINKNKKPVTFAMHYSIAIYVLASIAIVFFMAGTGVTIYHIIDKFSSNDTNAMLNFKDWLTYPLLLLICILGLVLLISMLIKTQYTVTDEYFITQYGLIKSKFPIKDITRIVIDKGINKVEIYFEENFYVYTLKQEQQEYFASLMNERNNKILIEFKTTPPKPKRKDRKRRR